MCVCTCKIMKTTILPIVSCCLGDEIFTIPGYLLCSPDIPTLSLQVGLLPLAGAQVLWQGGWLLTRITATCA